MQEINNLWLEFNQWEYATLALLVGGGIFVLIGAWKIIRSSLRLAFWFILAAIGFASVSYGLERSDIDLPPAIADKLNGIVKPGQNLSMGALEMLCTRLGSGAAEQAPAEKLPPLRLQ